MREEQDENVFAMGEYKARKAARQMPYKSDFEQRLERIRSSLNRINVLMKELREGCNENAQG